MGTGCFADDPVAFFVEESLYVHHMPLEQQEALQLEALQLRFAAMRDVLAPLTALADASRTRAIARIEDACDGRSIMEIVNGVVFGRRAKDRAVPQRGRSWSAC